jgi:hypothetical protein
MAAAEDLSAVVDICSLECLNERADRNILGLFPPSAGALLESDADEQLLLNIVFTQSVKLHSIEIVAPNDGRRPNAVKLFANVRIADFSDADTVPATQEAVLAWTPLDATRSKAVLLTKFVKFQDVKKFALFIESNVGGEDTTALSSITLLGTVLSDFNMKNLKKS